MKSSRRCVVRIGHAEGATFRASQIWRLFFKCCFGVATAKKRTTAQRLMIWLQMRMREGGMDLMLGKDRLR